RQRAIAFVLMQADFLAWLTVAASPVAILSAVIIIRQSKKATDKQQEEVSQLNAYLDEKISGQKAII
ncbi:ABC transporter ATP-binding protein, partial [Citrobacter sp. TBCS-11]